MSDTIAVVRLRLANGRSWCRTFEFEGDDVAFLLRRLCGEPPGWLRIEEPRRTPDGALLLVGHVAEGHEADAREWLGEGL